MAALLEDMAALTGILLIVIILGSETQLIGVNDTL